MNEVLVTQTQQVSLIDNIDVASIQQTMQKIAHFQAVVQNTLKSQHDYGIIPGTNKPTLLKPGGEKICMMLGVNPEYEFLDKETDYVKGFFNYEIRCTLMRGSQKVAQGVGSCNSYEKKYRWINSDTVPEGVDPSTIQSITDRYGRTKYKVPNPNICDLANTILKMGKKRAFIDAVLQVSSLSEIFTQDVEEMQDFIQQEQGAAASSMTPEEAGAVKLNFGKHKGKSLKELYKEDNQYFSWLKENTKDNVVKQACSIMMDALNNKASKANKPQEEEVTFEEAQHEDDPFE